MRSVLPDETRSTIASARPSRGASSTEPVTSTSVDLDGQQLARQPRVDRRDGRAGEILERCVRGLRGHGGLEPARAEAEPQQLAHVAPRSRTRSMPGDAAVDDAVLDVLGNVGGTDEQHVDRRVAARERERPLARLLRAEAGILEQRERRLAQPSLDRDGDRQATSPLRRSSASR